MSTIIYFKIVKNLLNLTYKLLVALLLLKLKLFILKIPILLQILVFDKFLETVWFWEKQCGSAGAALLTGAGANLFSWCRSRIEGAALVPPSYALNEKLVNYCVECK